MSAMASLLSSIPPSTDCSAARSCGGCRPNSSLGGAESMPGARSSTTAMDPPLPSHEYPNIHSITDIQSISQGSDAVRSIAPISHRAGTTVNVAGEYLKGPLFITLCIVCAYPSTPVLSGLWRTCGLIRNTASSLLIRAVDTAAFGVDKNLSGVSGQVTAPGVLSFGGIFAALRGGYEGPPATPLK